MEVCNPPYRKAVAAMKDEHERLADELRNAWRKLGLKVIEVTTVATATGGGLAEGLDALALPVVVGRPPSSPLRLRSLGRWRQDLGRTRTNWYARLAQYERARSCSLTCCLRR